LNGTSPNFLVKNPRGGVLREGDLATVTRAELPEGADRVILDMLTPEACLPAVKDLSTLVGY